MARLTPAQILAFARTAGFSRTRKHRGVPEDIMATAIALGESGGNPNAHNDRPPDNSYGLWQINMLGRLGPDRRQQFGIPNNEALFNPLTNAKAAYRVFKDAGNSFRPWSVYLHATYIRHLPAARAAADDPQSEDTPSDEGDGGNWWDIFFEIDPWWNPDDDPIDVRDPFKDVAAFASSLADFVGWVTDSKNWVRVALFVGGGVLLLAALIMIFGSKVADVVPAGKMLKKAVGK